MTKESKFIPNNLTILKGVGIKRTNLNNFGKKSILMHTVTLTTKELYTIHSLVSKLVFNSGMG